LIIHFVNEQYILIILSTDTHEAHDLFTTDDLVIEILFIRLLPVFSDATNASSCHSRKIHTNYNHIRLSCTKKRISQIVSKKGKSCDEYINIYIREHTFVEFSETKGTEGAEADRERGDGNEAGEEVGRFQVDEWMEDGGKY